MLSFSLQRTANLGARNMSCLDEVESPFLRGVGVLNPFRNQNIILSITCIYGYLIHWVPTLMYIYFNGNVTYLFLEFSLVKELLD